MAGLGALAAVAEEHLGDEVSSVAELLCLGSLIREHFACNLSLMSLCHDCDPRLRVRLPHRFRCDLLIFLAQPA